MAESKSDWRRATSIAFDAFEIAVRGGADSANAFDVALARVRAIIPVASESETIANSL